MGHFTKRLEYAHMVKMRIKSNKVLQKVQSDMQSGIPILYETYMQLMLQLPEIFQKNELVKLVQWQSIPTEIHKGYAKEVEEMAKSGQLTNTTQMENLWLKWYLKYNVPFYAV